MVAAYELVPSVDEECARGPDEQQQRSGVLHKLRSSATSILDGPHQIIRAHADLLDTSWRGGPDNRDTSVFVCFMLLRLGLLGLSILWGFVLVSPLWFMSLVSNDRFLPLALQMGLIVMLIAILEPLLFVALMRDVRSKIFYLLWAAYLTPAWRRVCLWLVHGEVLGQFLLRSDVKNTCFTAAGLTIIACGALAWTTMEGSPRHFWVIATVNGLLSLFASYRF